MVRLLYSAAFFLIFGLCSSMSRPSFELSELDSCSNQVIVDFAKKMQAKGLRACGLGGREDNGKLMDFQVSFQYGQALDVPSARRLLMETAILFLEEVNHNEKVQKYLVHYPFTPYDVIISILPGFGITDKKERDSSVHVRSQLGRISYYITNDPVKPWVDLCEETFEEALKILQDEDMNRPNG